MGKASKKGELRFYSFISYSQMGILYICTCGGGSCRQNLS